MIGTFRTWRCSTPWKFIVVALANSLHMPRGETGQDRTGQDTQGFGGGDGACGFVRPVLLSEREREKKARGNQALVFLLFSSHVCSPWASLELEGEVEGG